MQAVAFEFDFVAPVIEWRGPAPFFFVATTPEVSSSLNELKQELSYGWGVMHAQVVIADLRVKTALIPKDGAFLVPLKNAIRKPLGLEVGDLVELHLEL